MIGLDTNVLVRYLVADDKRQADVATALIEREEEIFLNKIVLCELVWVLEFCYKFNRVAIADVLRQLLSVKQFLVESRNLVWKAVEEFSENKIDFSDCLIGLVNQEEGCDFTFSFEKGLKKLDLFKIL